MGDVRDESHTVETLDVIVDVVEHERKHVETHSDVEKHAVERLVVRDEVVQCEDIHFETHFDDDDDDVQVQHEGEIAEPVPRCRYY